MRKKLILWIAGGLIGSVASGQSLVIGKMTLEEAIGIAYTRSPQAQMVQLTFMSQYWSFRSYKAQLLPSLNLSGNLGNYNRSLVEVRDPDDGRISYVANNTLSNTLSVRINQNIAPTGGKVSLSGQAGSIHLPYEDIQFDSGFDQLYSTLTFFQFLKVAEKNRAVAI